MYNIKHFSSCIFKHYAWTGISGWHFWNMNLSLEKILPNTGSILEMIYNDVCHVFRFESELLLYLSESSITVCCHLYLSAAFKACELMWWDITEVGVPPTNHIFTASLLHCSRAAPGLLCDVTEIAKVCWQHACSFPRKIGAKWANKVSMTLQNSFLKAVLYDSHHFHIHQCIQWALVPCIEMLTLHCTCGNACQLSRLSLLSLNGPSHSPGLNNVKAAATLHTFTLSGNQSVTWTDPLYDNYSIYRLNCFRYWWRW